MRDGENKRYDRALTTLLLLLLAAALAVGAVLAVALLQYDAGRHSEGALHSIAIEGEYSEEGGPWRPFTASTSFQNLDLRDITLRGHFNRAIPEGEKLYLNLDHMRVSLRVNGVELYRLEPVEGDGNLTRAMGKQYVAIPSPGITTEDDVELNFGNLYRNAYMIQFDELLRQMHIGNERMMFIEAVRTDGWTLGIGALFSFLTLLLVIASICCGVLRIKGALRFLWLGITTLFSSLWFFTLSPAPTLILPWPIFLNVLYALATQGMVLSFVLFLISNLSDWRRTLMKAVEGVLLAVLLVGLINQLLRVQDLYSAINYVSIIDIAVVVCAAFCLWYEAYRLKKEESVALLKALFLLMLGGVLELVNGYLQFSEAAILLGIGLISFVVSEGFYLLRRVKRSMESETRALLLERELEKSRTAVILSQIRPHFLYNALVGIKELCDTGKQATASKALEHFAYYMRGNLDSLSDTRLISFAREVSHVRDYLYLEKMRFEERLRVVWDLRFTDFFLPPLTLQPIVENAVRHGITKKKEGGTLTIRSDKVDGCIQITVMDDGVGFDMAQIKNDGRTHIGIENVRSRLWAQCTGTLCVVSAPGEGATVQISLPVRGCDIRSDV